MSDAFLSPEPDVPAEVAQAPVAVEAPAPVEEPPVSSEVVEVANEPPPTPEKTPEVVMTAEGVCLSKVERSAEGVILKVLED